MKIGRRLALKLFNLSRLVFGVPGDPHGPVEQPLDQAMLQRLGEVTGTAEAALEGYDYSRALMSIEGFFWWFCDDYVELVKRRAYRPEGHSARNALAAALSVLQRLFAPFLPFVCEEVWHCWQPGSVHQAPWPESRVAEDFVEPVLQAVSATLAAIRKAKSDACQSMKAAVARVELVERGPLLDNLQWARQDLIEAGQVASLVLMAGEEREVRVWLQEAPR